MTDRQVELSYNFYNVPEIKQFVIKNIVNKNIDGKLDAYLQKIYAKKDAQFRLNYKIQQNKQGRYESKFVFDYDGKVFAYSNKVGFKYVEDLVNHAFKRFKESISK